jgi:hypothetical protein
MLAGGEALGVRRLDAALRPGRDGVNVKIYTPHLILFNQEGDGVSRNAFSSSFSIQAFCCGGFDVDF